MRAYTTLNGLQIGQYTATQSGPYSITTRTTMQYGSAVVVTATQSGSASTSYTIQPTSPVSSDNQLTGRFNCAQGDLITVVISSSAPADQPPNFIKTAINLKHGV
jgi:hypothetical protein